MKGIVSAVIRVGHIPVLERHLRRGGRGTGAALGRKRGFLKSPPPLYRYLRFAAINVPQVLCERYERLTEACFAPHGPFFPGPAHGSGQEVQQERPSQGNPSGVG